MVTRLRGLVLMLGITILAGCASNSAPAPDPMQTIRDGLFYDGLAAFHEGYYKEAAIRWERAAHFGDGDAARNLGHLYRQGLGVEQDTSIAVAWYQVAADAGVASAQYNLGMVYLNGGPNFTTDRTKGLFWLNKAAAAGIVPAQTELARLASAPEPKPEPAAPAAVALNPPPAAAAPVVVETPAAPARVQIGSYQTRKAAEGDMARLKRRSDLGFQIVSGRDKAGRNWYRLMAVGKPDAVEAYCRQAATQRIGCWPGKK
jgi:uncharacterized protein